MITMQGTIPYPPGTDSTPIRALAADLKQMANGLGRGSSQLVGTASTAQANWAGAAAEAFANQMAKRATTIDEVARTIGGAAVPLQTLAAAIDTTSATYTAAAICEQVARAGLPWTAGALAAAIAAESAAVLALEAAGIACATALVVIEAKVAAGEYLLSQQGSHPTAAPSNPPAPAPAPVSPPPPAPKVATTPTSEIAWSEILDGVVGAAHRGMTVLDGAVHGLEEGLKTAVERFGATYVRDGRTLQRWMASRGGPSIGLMAREAAATATTAANWSRRIGPVGMVIDGVEQTLEDNHDTKLTTTQRVGRTSAAVAVQGGAAWAGVEVGAVAGAEVGAVVGAFFGGVGAVPGAVVGGFVGGVAGGIGGSVLGKAMKEWLFARNPAGGFQTIGAPR